MISNTKFLDSYRKIDKKNRYIINRKEHSFRLFFLSLLNYNHCLHHGKSTYMLQQRTFQFPITNDINNLCKYLIIKRRNKHLTGHHKTEIRTYLQFPALSNNCMQNLLTHLIQKRKPIFSFLT